jgi:hypothetical protein
LTKLAERLQQVTCTGRDGTHEFRPEDFTERPSGNRRVRCVHCNETVTKIAVREGIY